MYTANFEFYQIEEDLVNRMIPGFRFNNSTTVLDLNCTSPAILNRLANMGMGMGIAPENCFGYTRDSELAEKMQVSYKNVRGEDFLSAKVSEKFDYIFGLIDQTENSIEFFLKAKELLNPGGVLTININPFWLTATDLQYAALRGIIASKRHSIAIMPIALDKLREIPVYVLTIHF